MTASGTPTTPSLLSRNPEPARTDKSSEAARNGEAARVDAARNGETARSVVSARQSGSIGHGDREGFAGIELAEISLWKLTAIVADLRTNPSLAEERFSSWLSALSHQQRSTFQSLPPIQESALFLSELAAWLERGEIVLESSSPLSIERRVGIAVVDEWTVIDALRQACFRALEETIETTRFNEAVEKAAQRAAYHFAYGLSHEINNPLANISARAQSLLARCKLEDDRKSLATIVDQAQRAHEMLAEMMMSVQTPKPQLQRVDVVSLLKSAFEGLSEQCRKCELQADWSSSMVTCLLDIDPAYLLEAVGIAWRNSVEACRKRDSIRLILDQPSGFQAAPCEGIRIAICDNGPGLNAKKIESAWDLYFSGREAGRGLGIGLSKLRRLVEACMGTVQLKSAPDAGCIIEMYFRTPSQ